MTATVETIEKQVYTKEEREAFRAKREEFRSNIKALSAQQTEEKKLLRTNHEKLPVATCQTWCGKVEVGGVRRAAYLMTSCRDRAARISGLLDGYWTLLGHPSSEPRTKLQPKK